MSTQDPNHPGERAELVEHALEHIKKAEHDLEEARREERHAIEEIEEAARELERAAHLPPEETEIIVNARPRTVAGDEVGFEQVVQLAFPGSQGELNVVFSMTFRHAVSIPHAGELGLGGVVKVKKGTIFNVTKTVKS